MQFDWFFFGYTIALVAMSGFLASILSGTFAKLESLLGFLNIEDETRVTMPFVNHGGMWGDACLMSVVMGLIMPYIHYIPLDMYSLLDGHGLLSLETVERVGKLTINILLMAVSLGFTILAHILWARGMRNDNITGHMWPAHTHKSWHRDMSFAGWAHVGVMTYLLGVVFWYAVYPMPHEVIWGVSVLLTIHVFLGTVQPGWYCSGKLWTWGNFAPPLVATTLIWGVAAAKLH